MKERNVLRDTLMMQTSKYKIPIQTFQMEEKILSMLTL